MYLPLAENTATMMKASAMPRSAIRRVVASSIPSVSPRKMGVFASGFMMAKKAARTVAKKVA